MPNVGCKLGMAYQLQASRLAEELRKEKLDISVAEYLVLRLLYTGDGLQQCEIASALGKDNAAVCRSVKALEAKGMVVTEQISHKCLRVYLSPAAREIEWRIMKVARSRHDALKAILTDDELKAFIKTLDKIIKQSNKERNNKS